MACAKCGNRSWRNYGANKICTKCGWMGTMQVNSYAELEFRKKYR